MSQKGTDGSIRSFFKPVPRSQAAQAVPRKHSPSPELPSSPPVSSPQTAARTKTPPPRKLEIGATDDEDDAGGSSDDSLEDLSALLGRARPGNAGPSPSKPVRNPLATPKAKRAAVEFHSSPLAIMPKHKFDLKALAKDALQDDATHASSMRVRAAAEAKLEDDDAAAARETLSTLEGIVNAEGGQDAQRVIRTVQRSEPGQSRLRYCFFDENYALPSTAAPPRKLNNGPWKVLTRGDERTREQNLVSGLPHTLLAMHGSLPDELMEWMMNALCVSKSRLIQQEYTSILSNAPEQIEQLVTPQRLGSLFYRLGALPELETRDSELKLAEPAQEPYDTRDWSALAAFLKFLGAAAPHLAPESTVYAVQTLLRMSVDKVLLQNIDLLMDYESTMQALLGPISNSDWDVFCYGTCTLLHTLFRPQLIRINALGCLPVSDPKVHELRRRLAIAFLFDDPGLGRHHPDTVITIRGIIDHLGQGAFVVTPKTDFAELRASIIILNIAIDDGCFTPSDDPEDEKQFNRDIDELSGRLREIWTKINDAGMKLARTETKGVLEWVQQRLAYSVRTRKEAKKSVFDLPGQEDPFLSQQQNYMKKFFLKKSPGPSSGDAAKKDTAGDDDQTITVKGG